MGPESLSPIRVLLIDDSEHDRIAFRRCLKAKAGSYELTEFVRAEDLLEATQLELERYDVLVLDFYLPGISGLELGRTLRGRSKCGALVLMTGTGTQQLVIDALTGGFDDYIVKDSEGEYLKMIPTVLTKNFQRSEDRKAVQLAQASLAESERNYRDLFENTTDLIQCIDMEGRFIYVNDAWKRNLEYSEEDLLDRSFLDMIHPDDRGHCMSLFQRLATGESLMSVETRFVSASGRVINVLGSINCQMKDGVPVSTRGIFMDISDRKQVEEDLLSLNDALESKVEERTKRLHENLEELKSESRARDRVTAQLKESEARFRTIVEHAPEAILVFDVKEQRFVDCNEKAIRLFKASSEELLSCGPQSLMPSHGISKKRDLENLSRAIAGESVSFETLRKDFEDRVFPCEIRIVRLPFEGRMFLRFSLIDISERELAESERARLMTAVEQITEMVMVTDPEGVIEYVNPAFTQVTGYTVEETLGENMQMLQSAEENDVLHENIRESVLAGKTWRGQLMHQKKDGSLYTAEVAISRVKNASGQTVNFVGIMRDITHEIELERRLSQAQRLESIGTLAGGIAHDFNNILAGIMGYTDLAIDEVLPDSEACEFLTEIGKASNRAKDLVNQILAFSRQGEQEQKPTKLQSIVQEALELLRKAIPVTIEIGCEISPDCGYVLADSTQIHQVVMNLGTNAFHAVLENGGAFEIRLDRSRIGSEMARREGVAEGDYARIRVSDSGDGMDEATVARIFDPYFTTKDVGHGSGMGLATVLGIINEHKGTITVRSKPHEGSVFEVFLPFCVENQLLDQDSQEGDDAGLLKGGDERILFIDDDEALLNANRTFLEKLGYNITALTNGVEALEVFLANPDDFDLVITDHTMPRITGMELAREVLSIRPHTPVILCSGFSDKVGSKEAQEVGICDCIMKPAISKDIAQRVRKALNDTQK